MVPRRPLLRAFGIAVTAGLAGCNALSGDDPGDASTRNPTSTPTLTPTETLTPETPVSRTTTPPSSPETPSEIGTQAPPDTPADTPTVGTVARTPALTGTADRSVSEFGVAVGISEEVAVVVAEQDGAFVFDADGWRESAVFVPGEPDEFDGFDASVAVDGDRVVLGGPNMSAGPGEGVYLYERVDGDWTQRHQFGPEESTDRNQFGRAVGFDGRRVVVGDVNDPGTMVTLDGDAFVFAGTGTEWRQEGDLSGEAPDLFGTAAAVDGATALVGAPLAEVDSDETGAVHVYEYREGGWQRETMLAPAEPEEIELFGQAVAIDDTTAVVGAPSAADGRVFVFERGRDGWTQQARVSVPGLESGAEFGRAVDVAGERALVGAPMADATGRAYTLAAAEGWGLTRELAGSGLPEAAEFGSAVALAGDRALVGAPAFRAVTGAFLFEL